VENGICEKCAFIFHKFHFSRVHLTGTLFGDSFIYYVVKNQRALNKQMQLKFKSQNMKTESSLSFWKRMMKGVGNGFAYVK